ncbi:MAG: ATP-grasp fold amidoligase family protein [Aestuariivirga sp.]
MTTRSWTGIPLRMPHRLPSPVPELAFIVRYLLARIRWPHSRRRDFILSYLLHVSVLRRLPVSRVFYNDVLFRLKTGPTLKSPLAIRVSDKELVKGYIAEVVGEKYNVPTLAILTTPEEVDAFDFPARCIIKPTHASAELMPRRSGESLDIKRIKAWLKVDFSEQSYEANYRSLVPKIIVEPWVFDGEDIVEFSVLCLDGKARVIYASADRFDKYAVVNFDTDWNELPYTSYEAIRGQFEKPKHLAEIISVAERLAKDFFLVRIDTYYDGNTIKCGEITNCPGAGLCIFIPRDAELIHSRISFSEISDEAWDKFFDGE